MHSVTRAGKIFCARFAKNPPKGRSRIVVTILKRVCIFAICAAGFSGVSEETFRVSGVDIQRTVNTAVPIILNIRCIMVVLFAFRLVPIEARIAVIHVPIFCPNRTNDAPLRSVKPLQASACKIPTDADED